MRDTARLPKSKVQSSKNRLSVMIEVLLSYYFIFYRCRENLEGKRQRECNTQSRCGSSVQLSLNKFLVFRFLSIR